MIYSELSEKEATLKRSLAELLALKRLMICRKGKVRIEIELDPRYPLILGTQRT
jgi:hypothetical protein